MDEKKRTNRPLVLAAVMLAMFMAAVEATIVATAMPGIVADLGGFSLYSWVFSSYLLMQVVAIPLYGKLADLYGRKLIFSIGIIVFLIGSLLCGFSFTMEMLIISRVLQGLGAGAVQPIATTIVGDMYTKEERASIQGYLASIWGVSAIAGPLLGAFFMQYVNWSWVFWMNVPFGVLSMGIVIFFLHENVERKRQSLDLGGAGLLLVSISALMVVLVQFDGTMILSRTELLLLGGLSLICLIWFFYHERRVAAPIVTFSLWRQKEIRYANLASFTSGAMLMAVSSFLPTYVQGVLGQSPLIAGLTLTAMSIGWPLASTIAGKMMLKTGFRVTALIGGFGLLAGAFGYYLLTAFLPNPWWAGFSSFMLGAGLGFSTTTFVVSIQSSVDWKARGEATAMNLFMRLLGGAVGVALLGGILNNRLRAFLEREGEALSIEPSIETVNRLLEAEERVLLSPGEQSLLQAGLSSSLAVVFLALTVFAVLSFLFILLLPKDQVEEKQEH
ncbi:MFS transporter [Alkalihalobacillus oceani]|uniref:MDR family MFS transporter n=1 Tax=Halalkalibacter oceani TaxID=1653776 RepID=UPI00203D0886|nr:MDR family MFS transporter [Halalkalibacter oceani]MCM3762334.1 MFS transporter [Halalkalibacter oceani]